MSLQLTDGDEDHPVWVARASACTTASAGVRCLWLDRSSAGAIVACLKEYVTIFPFLTVGVRLDLKNWHRQATSRMQARWHRLQPV